MNRASRQHLKSVRILAASIMYVYVCAFVGKGGTVLRFDGFCSGQRHYDRGYSVEVRRSLFWSTSSGQCWSYSGKSGTNDMDDRTALWRRVNKVNEDRGEGGGNSPYII